MKQEDPEAEATEPQALAAGSIAWSGVAQFVRVGLQFVLTAILARLLTPNDFGMLAMVLAFANLVMILRDLGLPAAIIQQENVTEEQLSSCFWANVTCGLLLTIVFMALAPVIALFYDEAQLVNIVLVIASVFLVSSVGETSRALLSRQLKFKSLAIVEMASALVSGALAIFLAISGAGVWSLVAQLIAFNAMLALLLWLVNDWRPRAVFRWRHLRGFLGFGLNLTGFSLVNYLNRNLDNLLIGRFLGKVQLGVYSLAFRVMLFPLHNISGVVGRVMFPLLSAVKDDHEEVRRIYLKANKYIAALVIPMMGGLFVMAPLLVDAVLGSQWQRVAFIIRILALVAMSKCTGATTGWLYQSQGRTDIMFRWGILATTVNVLAIVIGMYWEIEGVVVAYAASTCLLLYPSRAIPFRLINLPIQVFLGAQLSVFLATAIMVLVVWATKLLLMDLLQMGSATTLAATVVVGLASYTGLMFKMERNIFTEMRKLLRQGRS